MGRFAEIVVSVFLLFCSVSPLAVGSEVLATPGSIAEQYLFSSANTERMQRGLKPLRWDDRLSRAAADHARAMADRASISHRYPGEADLASRGKLAGVRFSVIAENVAEASTAVRIHDAWMNSEDHRANLLDPEVDSVGISVLRRDGQLYAVEDFDRSVATVSLDEQELTIGGLLRRTGPVEVLPPSRAARQTCEMDTGFAGGRRPWFVMRYTADELNRLPGTLRQQLASGKFHVAEVGACEPDEDEGFTAFKIAVLLYP